MCRYQNNTNCLGYCTAVAELFQLSCRRECMAALIMQVLCTSRQTLANSHVLRIQFYVSK